MIIFIVIFLIDVKSRDSTNTVRLQKPSDSKTLVKKELESVAIGNDKAISILKREPETGKQGNEQEEVKRELARKVKSKMGYVSANEKNQSVETDMLKCLICSKRFPNPDPLKSHLLSVHEIGKTHACEKCGQKFDQKP